VDVALHLAWTVDPLRDAAAQRDICIGGTNRFLDGCVAGNVRHVLFVSSATAYGANPAHARPVDESEPLKDRWHFQYSAEKREAEGLMRRFAADRPGTLLQIVRPCIVGGPNVSNFISRNAERPFVMRVLGHDPMLQLVHEDDCAAAVVAIVRSRVPGAFNVAAEGGITLTEVARRAGVPVVALPFGLLARAADLGWRRGLRWITEAPPEFLWFMVHPWLVSAERLRRDVGFRFAFTAEQTLGQMLERLGSRRGG
jgi:UDP-glucose 4-epimerase